MAEPRTSPVSDTAARSGQPRPAFAGLRRIAGRGLAPLVLAALLAPAPPAKAASTLKWETTMVAITEPPGADKAIARFPFENTGPTAVRIVGVQTSCGCTVASATRSVYRPGEKGEIEATMTLGDRTGRQDKTVTVTTIGESGGESVATLMMRVQIADWFSCPTHLLIWQIGQPPREQTVEITIAPGIDGGRLSLNKIEPARAEARLEPVAPKVYRLHVRPRETTQAMTIAVTLSIDSADSGSRTLGIFAVVR